MAERQLILDGPEAIQTIQSLSHPVRLKILNMLANQMMSITDIATELDVSLASAAINVKKLVDAGLIHTHIQPGKRGSQKICSRSYDSITIVLPGLEVEPGLESVSISMPVGNYKEIDVEPTCGIASESGILGYLDDPKAFYEPDHVFAQIIWVGRGTVSYRFPNNLPHRTVLDRLELTMEICSEAPNFNHEWPSDITIWINDIEIGTWTAPGDPGGKHGQLTPSWWLDRYTQYGFLKCWSVTPEGSFIDGVKLSDVTLRHLDITHLNKSISVKIGNKGDAKNRRGFNLFGRKFGNYPQDIIMRMHYVKEYENGQGGASAADSGDA